MSTALLNDAELGLAVTVPTLETKKPVSVSVSDVSSSPSEKKAGDAIVIAAPPPKPTKKKASNWTIFTLWFNTYRSVTAAFLECHD